MTGPEPPSQASSDEESLNEPARELAHWQWLWEGDHSVPVTTHRPGLQGRIVVFFKRGLRFLLRPVVKVMLGALWDRQRRFNLVTVRYLQELHRARGELLRDLREVRSDLLRDVQAQHRRISHLEAFKRDGLDDIMRHSDALYSLLDQKLDRYRRQSRHLWSRLGSALALAEDSQSQLRSTDSLNEAWEDLAYLELEDRFRGAADDIASRVEIYIPFFKTRGQILDLGCGRGETLKVLGEHGLTARGVDLSNEMVARCKAQGLTAEQGDLLTELEHCHEESVGGILSLHVIEHLSPAEVGRLVRLAWRALEPGGVLILETPNPLSLVVAARNFWLDPTHRRPVHPETLRLLFELAGFDSVERLELRPFSPDDRLPEIDLSDFSTELRPLADRINRLRDRLDDLLFGFQDYAVVGAKPTVS
jgi:O-antigen chain-terminating methyltransferase